MSLTVLYYQFRSVSFPDTKVQHYFKQTIYNLFFNIYKSNKVVKFGYSRRVVLKMVLHNYSFTRI